MLLRCISLKVAVNTDKVYVLKPLNMLVFFYIGHLRIVLNTHTNCATRLVTTDVQATLPTVGTVLLIVVNILIINIRKHSPHQSHTVTKALSTYQSATDFYLVSGLDVKSLQQRLKSSISSSSLECRETFIIQKETRR